MGKTAPKGPAHAGSALELSDFDPAKLSADLAALAGDAGEALVGLAERGELFLGNAALFVDAYHRIRVPEYRNAAGRLERTGGTVSTPVREYANTALRQPRRQPAGGAARAQGHPAVSQLPGMHKGQLEADTSGHTLTLRKDGKVLVSVGFGEANACFNGKGTPRTTARQVACCRRH